MATKEEVALEIKGLLAETFELDPELIVPEAKLIEDLDLDSIDAVEIVIILEEKYNKKISETQLRNIETIQDITDIIVSMGQ